jgi:hypothetical protein
MKGTIRNCRGNPRLEQVGDRIVEHRIARAQRSSNTRTDPPPPKSRRAVRRMLAPNGAGRAGDGDRGPCGPAEAAVELAWREGAFWSDAGREARRKSSDREGVRSVIAEIAGTSDEEGALGLRRWRCRRALAEATSSPPTDQVQTFANVALPLDATSQQVARLYGRSRWAAATVGQHWSRVRNCCAGDRRERLPRAPATSRKVTAFRRQQIR